MRAAGGQVEQAIVNLVVNARDAMPKGGTLTIRITLPETQDSKSVRIEVIDTGPGVPENLRQRIFDPYFTTKEQGKGTGLGLAVSGSIVAAHGGKVELETSVGRGTTFRIIMAAMAGEWDKGETA